MNRQQSTYAQRCAISATAERSRSEKRRSNCIRVVRGLLNTDQVHEVNALQAASTDPRDTSGVQLHRVTCTVYPNNGAARRN